MEYKNLTETEKATYNEIIDLLMCRRNDEVKRILEIVNNVMGDLK